MTTERKVKQLPVRMPEEVYNRIKSMAFFTDTSMNDLVVRAVRQFLDTTGDAAQLQAMTDQARAEYRPILDKLRDL